MHRAHRPPYRGARSTHGARGSPSSPHSTSAHKHTQQAKKRRRHATLSPHEAQHPCTHKTAALLTARRRHDLTRNQHDTWSDGLRGCCCDLAPLKRRRMPVIEALDLCVAVLWLPHPFVEANHPSLSAIDSHPSPELAVDAFNVRTTLVLSGPYSVWNPITVNAWRRRVRGAEGCR